MFGRETVTFGNLKRFSFRESDSKSKCICLFDQEVRSYNKLMILASHDMSYLKTKHPFSS